LVEVSGSQALIPPCRDHTKRNVTAALPERLGPVNDHAPLGHARQEGGIHGGEFRPLAGGGHELIQIVGQERDVFPRPVLEDEGETAGGSYAGNGRR
jgi:hypothetical protein